MKKKVLIIVLLMILVSSIFVGCNLLPEEPDHIHDMVDGVCSICGRKPSVGLSFELSDDGAYYIVIGIGSCKDKDTIIPSTYEGLPVKSIGERAFYKCTSITSITIPSSVTSISEDAFLNWRSLTSINVDGNNQEYQSIDGNLYSKDGTTLVQYAIGKTDTFFTVPSSVTNIADDAFYYCSKLTSITIPSSVTSIGTFRNCTSLESVIFEEGSQCTSIGAFAFSGCEKLTSITIPNSVTSIGRNAFHGCSSLTSITIPNSLTSIDDQTFDGCTSLINVIFESGSKLNLIGHMAFHDCTSLTSITIPSSVRFIVDDAFSNCTSLTTVTLEKDSKLLEIEHDAFDGCTSLNKVEINDLPSWYNIKFYNQESNPLYYAKHLYLNGEEITGKIDTLLTYIGDYIFYDDGTEVYLVKYLGDDAQLTLPDYNDKDYAIAKKAFSDKYVTSVTIPNSVTSIGNRAFEHCLKMESVIFEEGSQLTSIGEEAFYDCQSLANITIPSGVTSIEHGAFVGCTNLTSIVIPDSVTYIGDYAFYTLSLSLTDVYFAGTEEQWDDISIGSGNELLTNASIHYNYKPE